jgi:DNA-binding IclR family transcriptional regulator
VPRPALSASRGIDILEFLASFPDRQFSLSEIVRATSINISSSYAILNVLVERGYVVRMANQKVYALGNAAIVLGQAAMRSHPMISRAQDVASDLRAELGLPVMLCTTIGREIVALLSLEDGKGNVAGMRAGDRVPLVAPSGMPFLAWSSEQDIDAWISRHVPRDHTLVAEWRRDLALTKRRGYQIQLRSTVRKDATILGELALNGPAGDYKEQVKRIINALDRDMAQPETIVVEESYSVLLIASPLFTKDGAVAYNLCLGGLPETVTGAQLTAYAERLMHACVEIMRRG